MTKNETLSSLYGELLDIIACSQIDKGQATQKKNWTFDEIMSLR